MNSPSFVCPPDSAVFESFSGKELVYQTARPLVEASDIVARVHASGNRLHCLIVTLDGPLAEAHFSPDIDGASLAVRCKSAGRYAELSRALPRLRELDLRVYLPAHSEDNTVAIQMLASVGLHGAVEFPDGPLCWDGLAELAAYAILGRCEHGSIEPFTSIASRFVPHTDLDWGRVLFDDPDRFLYLDDTGRVALTAGDLAAGYFIADTVSDVSLHCSKLADHRNRWRDFFRDYHPCASCPGWRLCRGRFADRLEHDRSCSQFFADLVDLAAQSHAIKQSASTDPVVWQP